jgi:hypothetical protein
MAGLSPKQTPKDQFSNAVDGRNSDAVNTRTTKRPYISGLLVGPRVHRWQQRTLVAGLGVGRVRQGREDST